MGPEQMKHNEQLSCDACRASILAILPAHLAPFCTKGMYSEFKIGANRCTFRKHPGFKDEPESFMTITQNQRV